MNPDSHTIQQFDLPVTGGHSLAVTDWGNRDAEKPIIFLHGGPGGGVSDRSKVYFDPAKQRVIFFDQRGCGQSRPYGERSNNTTADLIADISAIADHLKIDTFVLTGGSWGSCLALAYGLEHPRRVSGMVLRGIFTGSLSETEWIEQGGFRSFFPDAWQQYLNGIPADQRHDPQSYISRVALGDDLSAAAEAAYNHDIMEGAIVTLDDRHRSGAFNDFDPNPTKLEIHYIANNCFLPDNFILDNAHNLTMPVRLIQGRYDMVCPPITAQRLHDALPDSELYYVLDGHAGGHETEMVTRAALASFS